MPTTGRGANDDRVVSAMGERVARVETKIEGVERDTGIIRAAIHEINNEMQKFVGLEAQCVAHLAQILEDGKRRDLVLSEIVGKVHALSDESFTRKGGWRAATRIATAIMALITMSGTIAAGIIWFLGKVVTHSQ